MNDENDTRNIAPRIGSPLWIYMTAVTVTGSGVLGVAVFNLGAITGKLVHPMFWVVAGMVLVGEVWRIATPGRPSGDSAAASRSVTVGVMLFWGFPIAVVLRAACVIVGSVAQRYTPQRALFNVAQLSLSLAAAGSVLFVLGVNPMPGHPWMPDHAHLLALSLAAVTYFAVNLVLVSAAVALRARSRLGSVIRANLRYQTAASIVLFGTAPLIAVAMRTGSPLIVALFMFPLATIYLSAATSVRREHQVNHDELTGLVNRKLLGRRGRDALAIASAAGTRAGFLLIDLDRATGLKQVNDTLGHAVGDRLLQVVAHRLSHSVRPGDIVARLGGDEFAVLLPAMKDASVAREVAARLRAALAEPVRLETINFDIRASIGIAVYPDDAASFEQLMQRADVAMYVAKERGNGTERYNPDYDRNSADRLALLGELHGSIRRREIEVYFQPKVRLSDGVVTGMEALARWSHPRRGVLAAADFVAFAEQAHLMSELTEQVIDKALGQANQWWSDGRRVQVCVNLPARDLLGERLVDLISQALRRHDLPPGALRVEVDGQRLAGNAAKSAVTIAALADLGVGVSLDDFGTGYSSLVQLTGLGVSEVKLDPVLIRSLPDSADHAVTVKHLVMLARSLGIESVGEGVETEAVAAALRLIGCDGAQGWYFARPLNAAMAREWLAENYSSDVPQARLLGQRQVAGPCRQDACHDAGAERLPDSPFELPATSAAGLAAAAPAALAAPAARSIPAS